MSARRCSILVLVLSGLPIFAVGQNPPAQNLPAQNPEPVDASGTRPTPAPALSGLIGMDTQLETEDSSGDLPQIPTLFGGPKMSLAFPSEQERSNYLHGGLNVSAAYDDNAVLTPSGAIANTSYSIFPNISIEQTRSRARWTLGYAGGLTVNERLSSRNQGSHDFAFDSQFRLSPHVTLHLAEDFSLVSGFFDSSAGAYSGGSSGGGNTSIIAPLSKQRTSSTVAEVNYHFALKDLVGVSGSFYDLHFDDVPTGYTLANSQTAAGSVFWFHRLLGRDWAGVSYRFQRLTFDPGAGETLVHTIMFVNTVSLPGRFTVSGFLGPERSDNHGSFVVGGGTGTSEPFGNWSLAGGVDAGWRKDHTSVAAGYSRRINDGGGVLGAVRAQSVHGSMRQELRPGWAIAVSATYGSNDSITAPVAGSAQSLKSATLKAELERNLGKSIGFQAGYEHDFQDQIGTADPALQGGAHRNRFYVTLGYQWARALGR